MGALSPWLIGAALGACSFDPAGTGGEPLDAQTDTAALADSAVAHDARVDAADGDTSLVDSGGPDTAVADTNPLDTGLGDTRPDLGTLDTAVVDTAGDSTALDTGSDMGADAGVAIGATSVASDSLAVDRVRGSDGAIATDGTRDGAFLVTLQGPFVALALITTDTAGAPSGSQQWDTYVGTKAVPAAIGAGFSVGSQTWQLGVWEGTTLVNKADGSLGPLGPGPHALHVYAQPSGWFSAGKYFRVVAELADGTLVRGPVVTY